jgi:SAM-dependent methyltransferase
VVSDESRRADAVVVSQPREYYEETYHFDEDVERPNLERLWRAMQPLQPLSGTAFLDLGCGVGWANRLAITRGAAALAVGLDFSRRALRMGQHTTPAASWVQGDGTALPFGHATFDRVFSFGSVEHFPDIRLGLREVHRALRVDGSAVVVVPNFWVRTDQPLEFRATQRGWTRLMTDAGFRVVAVGTDSGPSIFKNRKPLRMVLRVLVRLLSLIPPLRYQFVFVLRK